MVQNQKVDLSRKQKKKTQVIGRRNFASQVKRRSKVNQTTQSQAEPSSKEFSLEVRDQGSSGWQRRREGQGQTRQNQSIQANFYPKKGYKAVADNVQFSQQTSRAKPVYSGYFLGKEGPKNALNKRHQPKKQ